MGSSSSSMCGAPAGTVPISLEAVNPNHAAAFAETGAGADASSAGSRPKSTPFGATTCARGDTWADKTQSSAQTTTSTTSSACSGSSPRAKPTAKAEQPPATPESKLPGTLSLPSFGGLAARRNFKGSIAVASNKKAGPDTNNRHRTRKIQWCPDLRDLYEIGSEVMPSCHSGMQVLFGRQRNTGAEVVIKVRAKKASFREDEEKEWRLSTEYMLNLPQCGNIAKLYEVLEDVDSYYVVMEKCAGQDLFESIHNQSKLNTDEVREVLFQILTALADMHAEGLVHKDLKLENVMIDRTPSTSTSAKQVWPDEGQATSPVSVKLVDFDTVEEHTPKTPKRAKDVLGTDQYISQEAYAGKYSPASDIFAVGVIAFRLLVNRFPFDAKMFNDKPGENWVGSPKMKEIRDKLCNHQVNYEHRVFQREPQAMMLVRSMMNMKEMERPSAREALMHPWFAKVRSPTSSPKSPTSSRGPGGAVEALPASCVWDKKPSALSGAGSPRSNASPRLNFGRGIF